jgi:hypothetical protein
MSEGNGSTKKTALLGMPGYGPVTPGAARGFYRASKGLELRLLSADSSLLAQNMNILWCSALNHVHRGERLDYFAMLHSDIEPEDFWLDKLVAEMEAKELDVLGVVCPIKDQRGVTSTALARPDGDTWRVRCRLTMQEVYRLPETFTSEDVGHPLLINTGCWVCRFDEQWAKKVHFTINDRLIYLADKKEYRVEVEPEDWFISRLFHELGLKVGCTRKVELGHRGQMVFGNTKPWGTNEFDKEYVTNSVLPDDGFPRDVDGWLSEAEGKELRRLADGKRVLEIGSFCGRSTICLAQTAERVDCIDPFDGRATDQPGSTLEKFESNLARYGVRSKVSAHRGTANEVAALLPDGWFNLIFIDGDHSLESVRLDIEHARRLLAPGGLIAFHDYRLYRGEVGAAWDPGVTGAVNELLAAGGELLHRVDSLAVVRPPAEVLQPVGE